MGCVHLSSFLLLLSDHWAIMGERIMSFLYIATILMITTVWDWVKCILDFVNGFLLLVQRMSIFPVNQLCEKTAISFVLELSYEVFPCHVEVYLKFTLYSRSFPLMLLLLLNHWIRTLRWELLILARKHSWLALAFLIMMMMILGLLSLAYYKMSWICCWKLIYAWKGWLLLHISSFLKNVALMSRLRRNGGLEWLNRIFLQAGPSLIFSSCLFGDLLTHHHDLLLHCQLSFQTHPVFNDMISISEDPFILFLIIWHPILNLILCPLFYSFNHLSLTLDETLRVLRLATFWL